MYKLQTSTTMKFNNQNAMFVHVYTRHIYFKITNLYCELVLRSHYKFKALKFTSLSSHT
jgi:hypothetical protein